MASKRQYEGPKTDPDSDNQGSKGGDGLGSMQQSPDRKNPPDNSEVERLGKEQGAGVASNQKPEAEYKPNPINGRVDANDDSEVSEYRVLTQNSIIDGEHFEKPDKKGGYGTVKISERYADQLMSRGVGLAEVDEDC